MDIINYKGVEYPLFQSMGNAAQFAIPYAKHLCTGTGYDIGCGSAEQAFPGAIPIDITIDDDYDALNLPFVGVDYVFSSHCLEHLSCWGDALDYWDEHIASGGVMFLYLPDYSQVYWRPWNNRKHKHVLAPNMIIDWMEDKGYTNIFASGVDLNSSFMVVGEKL